MWEPPGSHVCFYMPSPYGEREKVARNLILHLFKFPMTIEVCFGRNL
jgi:hypothetical protein